MPPPYGRVLICRNVNGNIYVDMVIHERDESCGLAPYPTLRHVTHWMHPPEPPAMLHGAICDFDFDYEIDGDS
jgi:hypothetical protein